MATAILDSKGRLVIPPEILERLHLKPGDAVRVDVDALTHALACATVAAPASRPPTLTPVEAAAVLNDRSGWADVDGAEYVRAIRQEWEDRLTGPWGENDTP